MNQIEVSNQEIATILAALRYWQSDLAREYEEAKREGREPIIASDHFADHKPLSPRLIDSLCERLNFAGKSEKRLLLLGAKYCIQDRDNRDGLKSLKRIRSAYPQWFKRARIIPVIECEPCAVPRLAPYTRYGGKLFRSLLELSEV